MAINKKLIHFKTKENFDKEVANGNILDNSICFILDTKEIYTHGLLYDGSTFDPSNIEKSIENIINNKADKTEIPTKTSDLTNDDGFITINDVSELTNITYSELKALRDGGQLNEGHLYRITDYVTTTTLWHTKSAGNAFDVIVLAVSANELSHIAKAIQHEGDTYFDGNDLGAWELWYDLDNDTDKYEWADATNGKGVIYRMIDEKRNDCPYDFKNILFYNDKYTDSTTTDKYYFTFSYVVSGVLYDGTVEKRVDGCYGNEMGIFISSTKKSLSNNVFRNRNFYDYCRFNTFSGSCYSNTFDYSCYGNTFGKYCSKNTFSYNCCYNTFGNNCLGNTFSYNCCYNTFGNRCCYNTFGYNCGYNTFEDNVFYYNLNSERTSISRNDEYYDDGSGKLVPIKHPDLSTQPSILPYKFMGQYVYEILLPIPDIDVSKSQYIVNASKLLDYVKDLYSVTILQAEELLFCHREESVYPAIPMFVHRNISIDTRKQYGGTAFYELEIKPNQTYTNIPMEIGKIAKAYLRIVYTSIPKESGYSYGYNNY